VHVANAPNPRHRHRQCVLTEPRARAQKLRGVTLNVLYGEETAFMNVNVFLQVMVPLIEMIGAVLIMISTLVNQYNFYTKLMQLKDPATNKPLINSYVCELICSSCKRTRDPTRCRHMLHMIPPWKNPRGFGIVSLLYGANKHLMARESMGAIVADGSTYFTMHDIEFLMNAKRYKYDMRLRPSVIIVTCDPNALGGSGFTFTAMVHHATFYTVRI
jgi:hypothetical protein